MARTRSKFLTLLFAVLQLFFLEVLVSAAAIPENPVLEKRDEAPPPGFYAIRGAQSQGGRCYPRQNIEVLQRNADQFNMLILAFDDLQRNPGPDPSLSWYGVGGIHGRPYTAWQQPASNAPFNTNLGYCVHTSPLFTLWHRPYVLLCEQLLHQRAVAIANRFTDANRNRYVTAADQLRLPYMDWSDPAYGGRIPDFVSTAQISVIRPSATGTAQGQTINNPLYRYFFTAQERGQLPGNFATFQYTTRDPAAVSATPVNRDTTVNDIMTTTFTGRRSTTYRLYSYPAYNTFATQCESIHNNIHRYIGGEPNGLGHMRNADVAAFDPIFWLHHSNVDRLVALYQAIYPDNRLTTFTPARATYGRVVPGVDGSTDSLSTRLYPFRRPGSGTFYRGSDFVSGTTGIWGFGYGYPEIPCGPIPLPAPDAAQLSANVRTAVNRLYGPGGPASKRRRAAQNEDGFTPSDGEVAFERPEYNLRFFIDQAEIPGQWACYIFLGTVPNNTASYATSSSLAGIVAPFTSRGARMQSMLYTYDFCITDQLLELGVSPSESEVSDYLIQNLKYVIMSETGSNIDPASLKTFKIGVCTSQGTYAESGSDKLASYSDCKVLTQVTEDKPGGVTTEYQLEVPVLLNGTAQNVTQKLETY